MAAFCDLLLHIKGQISRFLAPTSELLSGFDSPELLECGFLGEFEKSSDLTLALAASKTTLGEKFSAILSEFFSGFGKEYRDGEISRVEYFLEQLRAEEAREREELKKSERLTRTLLTAAALALAILLI